MVREEDLSGMHAQMMSEYVQKTALFFASNVTKSYQFRVEQLCKLRDAVCAYERRISDALYKDLHKAPMESYLTEIGMVRQEIRFLLKHLKKWMKPQRVHTPLSHFFASSKIYYEPYGTVLIMSPWNYPVNLTLVPLAGAIAAGNCAVVKSSAYSIETSKVIADLIAETFDPAYITVVTGGREENTELLAQRFDYIFFTGGIEVGKLVMQAAAKNLTPVTLELGGKSPCIVDRSANINKAARRIIFGKLLNGGQTCVAPDYVLIHDEVKQAFIEQCKVILKEFLPTPAYASCTMPRIINDKHFERLVHLAEGERTVLGGEVNAHERFIPLTLLDDITFESPIMQEEIFGPLLPLITFTDLQWAVNQICAHPKPLALYLFTQDAEVTRKVLSEVSFGGGCINDTIMHLASPFLPFGGIGASGMGNYHGKYSFYTFSHQKSVIKKSLLIDMPVRYHPYSEKCFSFIKKFLKICPSF